MTKVADLDDVQLDLESEAGEHVREQLARRVWERSGRATIAIAFRDRDKAGEWKAPKLTVMRFRRMHEVWQREMHITLAGDEARELATWIGEALAEDPSAST